MAIVAIARLLDGICTRVLRVAIAHGPRLRRAARSRAYRFELFALVGVGGVPRLVADIRYLVLRPYSALRLRTREFLGRWLAGASAR